MFKFLARNTFNLIGGMFIGLSIPMNHGVLIEDKPLIDLIVFAPIGIILLSISYYYKFIKK